MPEADIKTALEPLQALDLTKSILESATFRSTKISIRKSNYATSRFWIANERMQPDRFPRNES